MREALTCAAEMSDTNTEQTVSVAAGDGIGPEITAATIRVLAAARAPLNFQHIDMGLQCWQQGLTSGVPDSSWSAMRSSGVLLKGPMTTPQGSGMKSLNVTLRKTGIKTRLRTNHSLCFRICHDTQAQAPDLHDQRQHHEIDRRIVPRSV
jgi:isocitrate/isopropylmalate dehydrogenase